MLRLRRRFFFAYGRRRFALMDTSRREKPRPADELTLSSLLTACGRRKRLLLWPPLTLLVLVAAAWPFSTRKYRAVATIQVQKQDGGALGLESAALGFDGSTMSTDALDYTMTLQTTAAILRSPQLALAVIERTGLEQTRGYFQPAEKSAWSPVLAWPGTTLRSLTRSEPIEPLAVPLRDAPNRRYVAEKIFSRQLKIQPLTGTRLISIGYTDRDPRSAAAVANMIPVVLAEMTSREQLEATRRDASWLDSQIAIYRKQAEAAEARAAALQRSTGTFGPDAAQNIVLDRLQSLNQTLTAAESNRILKQSIDLVARDGSPELISSLSGNSSTGAVASMNTSLSLIQDLQAQRARIDAELRGASERYGPAYPEMSELQARRAGIDRGIQEETARLGKRAHTDRLVAEKQEQAARIAFEQQKQLAMRQNDAYIAYELARDEARSSQQLYEGLEAKLKTINVLEGMGATNVEVLSPASVPSHNDPVAPNMLLRMAAALLAGLVFGGMAAIHAEWRDDSVASPAALEELLGFALIAVLPRFVTRQQQPGSRQPVAVTLEQANAPYSEAMRCLRSEFLRGNERTTASETILVTSSAAGEGRTTVALNLALVLAQAGSRVLLVDADLRKPTLAALGPGSSPGTEPGLATALSGPRGVSPRQPVARLPELHLLASSEEPPRTADLLSSGRMAELLRDWKQHYRYIVLDSAPVLGRADTTALVRLSDTTLVVAAHRSTQQTALRRTMDILQRHCPPDGRIGCVLNLVEEHGPEWKRYYGMTRLPR